MSCLVTSKVTHPDVGLKRPSLTSAAHSKPLCIILEVVQYSGGITLVQSKDNISIQRVNIEYSGSVK